MNCRLYSSIILVCLLKYSSAIEYSQILNTAGPEEFVDLTAADFRTVEEYEDAEIKQAIMDELTRNGELLTDNMIRFLDNPTQAYGKIEGDIELPPNLIIDFSDTNYWNLAYSAVADNRKRWPNGVIPYKISSSYQGYTRNMIGKENNLPTVGRMGGRQEVSLDVSCFRTKHLTVVHELMHAAGFYHEQARYDRDNHVSIHWQNIEPGLGTRMQFKKRNASVISLLGLPYDQHSIMHYEEHAFSISPSLRSISAKDGGTLSNNYGLTDIDVMKINNLYGCTNKSVSPKFGNAKSYEHVVEGTPLILHCDLVFGSGIPTPKITWMFEANNLTAFSLTDSGRKSSYSIRNATRDDEGQYLCEAKNEAGSDRLTFTVLVMQPPAIIRPIPLNVVVEHQNIAISCRTTGYPKPKITWWFNGEKITDSFKAKPNKYELNEGRLTLNEAERADAGIYECTGTNYLGTSNLEIVVDVVYGPSFAKFEHFYAANETDEVTMECSATANPEATIIWWKAGVELRPNLIIFSSKRDKLFIKNVTQSDNGTYQCMAQNNVSAVTNKYIPEVTCRIELPPYVRDKPGELRSKLINHFTDHHSDINAIKVAIQIIRTFDSRNWFAVSCNNDDDVTDNGHINVKVDDRQHLFFHYNDPEWNDATEASVKWHLNLSQWTLSSNRLRSTLNMRFSGGWSCVTSSTNDTVVYGNEVNVRVKNNNKFITVTKWHN